jgi:D-alanyl-D-alanine carboxypeptidase
MMRPGFAALAFSLALGPAFTPPSVVADLAPPELPELTAKAWLLYDADTGVTLASHNADDPRPMASVTKIMTALVVMENAGLDEQVRVSATAEAVGESEIGLAVGEVWSVADLVAAMMVRSGNDAAMALAEHVGGSVKGFAAMMNSKAENLGLENSHFTNPHGLDASEHYTSATDLRIMAEAVLKYPYIARVVRTRQVEFTPNPQGDPRVANTTNKLLGVYPGVVGIKTGFTSRAGLVLVSALDHNGRNLISVVMGSRGHFDDTRELLEYGIQTVSLRDRFVAPLLPEEGGGGVPDPIPAPLFGDLEAARLAAVDEIPAGSWATTAFRATDLGQEIEAWLRSVTPATLGGAR